MQLIRYPVSEEEVESGDRYPVKMSTSRCACDTNKLSWEQRNRSENLWEELPNETQKCYETMLTVKPYSYFFRAPVKGRWLHHPLLNVFVKEFAIVPNDTIPSYKESDPQHEYEEEKHKVKEEENTSASKSESFIDPRITLPAYIDELCSGLIYLHGREGECRAAGWAYKESLFNLYKDSSELTDGIKRKGSSLKHDDINYNSRIKQLCVVNSSCNSVEIHKNKYDDDKAVINRNECNANWDNVKAWLLQQTKEYVYSLLDEDKSKTERWPHSLLLLRQKDVILHHVWRREGFIQANEPIVIVDYKPTLPTSSHSSSTYQLHKSANEQLFFLALSKPAGVPVHPSGAFRKNSITSILEDVFGGVDKDRYELCEVEDELTKTLCYVSVVHKKYRFELIRILIANTWNTETHFCMKGLSIESYLQLKQMIMSDEAHEGVTSTSNNDNVKEQELHSSQQTQERTNNNNSSNDTLWYTSKSKALKVFVVHRLDCATSGVLIFGLDKQSARILATAMSNKQNEFCESINICEESKRISSDLHCKINYCNTSNVENTLTCNKEYIALVHGKFDVCYLSTHEHHCSCCKSFDKSLIVSRSIGCLSPHLSLYWCPSCEEENESQEKCTNTISMFNYNNNSNSKINCIQDECDAPYNEEIKEIKEEELTDVSCKSEASLMSNINTTDHRKKNKRNREELERKHAMMHARTLGKCYYYHSLSEDHNNDTNVSHDSNKEIMEAEKAENANHANSKEHVKTSNFFTPSVNELYKEYKSTLRNATSVLQLIKYDAHCNVSLVKCSLVTGRTHQLRVHLASLGHPIVNDVKYVELVQQLKALHGQLNGNKMHDKRASNNNDYNCVESTIITAVDSNHDNTNVNCNNLGVDDVKIFYENIDKSKSDKELPLCSDDNNLCQMEEYKTSMSHKQFHLRGISEHICLHAWKYTITKLITGVPHIHDDDDDDDDDDNTTYENDKASLFNDTVVMHIEVPLPS